MTRRDLHGYDKRLDPMFKSLLRSRNPEGGVSSDGGVCGDCKGTAWSYYLLETSSTCFVAAACHGCMAVDRFSFSGRPYADRFSPCRLARKHREYANDLGGEPTATEDDR